MEPKREKDARRIARMVVKGLIAAGYRVNVAHKDAPTLDSTDVDAILAAMFVYEFWILFVTTPGKDGIAGMICADYPGPGFVVESSSANLHRALRKANRFAERRGL